MEIYIPFVKTDMVIDSTYDGTNFDVLMGFISIYQKYKERVCFPTIGAEITSIKWIDGDELIVPDQIWDDFNKCNKRMTVIPIILYNRGDEYSHMNLLIYDKNRLDVQRFDPNGESDEDYNCFFLDEKLKFELWEQIDSNVNYIPSDNNCPLQVLQENQMSSEGYCSAWCFWYLELRLSNVDKDPFYLEKEAYESLKKRDDLLHFIRGYSAFLLSMIGTIKYLVKERFDIDVEVSDVNLSNKYVKKVIRELLPMNDSLVLLFSGLSVGEKY
jgi:hypothetical protein